MLLMAAAGQAAEAVGLCVAVILNVIDSVSGDAWTTSNAIGFIVLEAIVAVGVAWIASGIARFRPWSRTPAVMTQVFTILIALWLLEAHRYALGDSRPAGGHRGARRVVRPDEPPRAVSPGGMTPGPPRMGGSAPVLAPGVPPGPPHGGLPPPISPWGVPRRKRAGPGNGVFDAINRRR